MAQVSSTSIDIFSSLSQVFNGSLSTISSCWCRFLSATLYTLHLYLEDGISKKFVLHVSLFVFLFLVLLLFVCLFYGRCQLCSTNPRWPPVLPCVLETKYASSLLRVGFLLFKKFKLLHPATLILPIKAKWDWQMCTVVPAAAKDLEMEWNCKDANTLPLGVWQTIKKWQRRPQGREKQQERQWVGKRSQCYPRFTHTEICPSCKQFDL